MSQGGRRDLIPIRSEALPSHQLHCLHGFLADALEMHIEPFSSMRYCLSCLVLKHISTALLSFGVFSFHTTITIIYFHTLKHTHITKGNLQRSEAHLSSCSLWSGHIPPSCVSYNAENQGTVIMGHSVNLANLCMLLISALPSAVFKSQR